MNGKYKTLYIILCVTIDEEDLGVRFSDEMNVSELCGIAAGNYAYKHGEHIVRKT